MEMYIVNFKHIKPSKHLEVKELPTVLLHGLDHDGQLTT
jgi:hypothetical protein